LLKKVCLGGVAGNLICMRNLASMVLFGCCLAGGALPALAQCKGDADDQTITPSPSQPTVTDSPDPIAKGVAALEYGWQQDWIGGEARVRGSGVLFKMGLICNFEFRAFFTAWQSAVIPPQYPVDGIGDTWFTGQYRVHRQSAKVPALSIQYTFKQPTADSRKGLGSGQRDHIVAMSAGKDFEGFSFAFETKYILFGKADSEPFSRRQEYSLEASHDLVRHLSLTGEIYGDTRSSTGEPGIVSSLWALSYSPKPRVIFDSGMDFGVTHGAPSKRFFAGVSYALGDVYKALRHQRP
jgi:hypothetical protein